MQEFSIRDIERMSGIKAHTLRVWEQRHGLALPHRRESQHRYYTNEDLQRILRIAWLYHQGYKISYIAGLSEQEISELLSRDIQSGRFSTDIISRMTEASRHFDADGFEKAVRQATLQLGMEKATLQVFYPFLEHLGLLWMNEEVIPAQEHFASMLLRNRFIKAIDELPSPQGHLPPVVLFEPEEEYHELPLLFIEYVLKRNGFRTVNFGANTPADAIEQYCHAQPVAGLHYHQVTNFTHLDVDEYLDMWCLRYPQLQVAVSGPLAVGIENPPPNARVLKSLDMLMDYCRMPLGQ